MVGSTLGGVLGGGLGLAVCCDIRICSDNSRFALPAAKLGLGYSYPGIKRLVDVVGQAFAKEIFFTARQFDAEEARGMGLVNRIVPDLIRNGRVPTPGIGIVAANEATAARLGVEGVLVVRTMTGSPCAP